MILLFEEFYFLFLSFFFDSDSETMFTFAESGAISHTNTKKRWIQHVAGIPRIPLKLLWSESADLKFIASTEEKRGQQESAEQRDHRLAQRRQHRQREKEEQETNIKSGSITFSSQKPFTCVKKKMIYVEANLVSSVGVLPMYWP